MRFEIRAVHARQVWDSRGRPTVEAEVALAGGASGRAIAPAGASRGEHEAVELRDGGEGFGGQGVDLAVANVCGPIASALAGADASDQAAIDARLIELDGTANKARLGGNALVAVSLAVLQAAAAAEGLPLWRHLAAGAPVRLPLPEVQIFGGGAHAGRRTDVQDFMIMAPHAGSLRRALEITAAVYRAAGALMAERGPLAGVADEGGWWPAFDSNEAALEALTAAIERAGFRPGEDVFISLDIAASEFGRGGRYRLALDGRGLGSEAMVEMLAGWTRAYPILSIEDPAGQDDPAGMAAATRSFGDRVQVIGDDFLVTSAERVRAAAMAGAANAALIKVNQAGTVSEAKAALDAAKAAHWGTIVSARSGESEDVAIAHLAVGWDAGQIKVGSFARSERMAKWNELLRIEEALGADAVFAGADALPVRPLPARP
ncbi:phosphopyruvate hydratase [Phenylobacterium montanum]|uniref:Enolase n=1 Tax=Phenylobacterium montanum TaxID=2823693 RepID=A0A975FZ84_9CAUL|nr:phosphopyruvate hydratase [Caulobacter sp. S6]QUD87652.1 phosphopyruvate hydratase [Caulobacter sp. S6]